LPFFANLLCTLLDLFMCDTVVVRAAHHILGRHVKVFSYKKLLLVSTQLVSKKFEMAVMVYSHAWGKLIHEKNQKSKIS
jgi:hypothetical protein